MSSSTVDHIRYAMGDVEKEIMEINNREDLSDAVNTITDYAKSIKMQVRLKLRGMED